MSKEELEKQLETVEHKLWLHNFIDHFTLEDISYRDKLINEISDIRRQIKELEEV